MRELSYYASLPDVFRFEVADGLGGHLGFLGDGLLATMSRQEVAALGVDAHVVMSQAIANLEGLFPMVVSAWNGLYDIEVESFAPSFMLLPQLLPSGEDGERVVWPVGRDLLLVTGRHNQDALARMRASVEELGYAPMVEQPYCLTEGGWIRHSG